LFHWQNVVLPVDLLEGNYAFLAKTYDHETFSPPFTVWGIAAADGQESNIVVDQSDVQFGSVPTFTASVVPNDVLSQPTAQSPQPSSQSSMEARGVPVPILVMILLGALILIIFSARKLIQKK